jgi:hypothetical protein
MFSSKRLYFPPELRNEYRVFCQKHRLPLHFQAWWLDAVCGPDAWRAAVAKNRQGEIIGVLPYHFTRRWGIPVMQLPPLTTYAGPWLLYPQNPDFKTSRKSSYEQKVMAELIRQLPKRMFFKQNFRTEITNWLPFYWAGFRQTTRYTYIFEPNTDLEKITAGFKHPLRNNLKKAAHWAETYRDDDAWATLFALNKQSFLRKKRQTPHRLEIFQNLHFDLQKRGQSACFIARNRENGAPSAGLYLAFDDRQASVLLTGTQSDLKSRNAIYALVFEAIQFCAARSIGLDFEGSMDPGIERFFRSFGARLVPYFQVWRIW